MLHIAPNRTAERERATEPARQRPTPEPTVSRAVEGLVDEIHDAERRRETEALERLRQRLFDLD